MRPHFIRALVAISVLMTGTVALAAPGSAGRRWPFHPHHGRRRAAFDGGHITSGGSGLLLREVRRTMVGQSAFSLLKEAATRILAGPLRLYGTPVVRTGPR